MGDLSILIMYQDSMVFQMLFKVVFRMLHRCFILFQVCFIDNLKKGESRKGGFKSVSIIIQGCFRLCLERFKGSSRKFQGCFKN